MKWRVDHKKLRNKRKIRLMKEMLMSYQGKRKRVI